MAGTTFKEFTCSIAPHRLFHALYLDSHNLMPKIMLEVKSCNVFSGDGGYPVKHIKNRLDFMDKENYAIKYVGIECEAFGDQIDCVSHEVKFDATPDGGSICKIKSTFFPKGNVVIDEELLNAGREGYMEKFPFFIAHLTENPHLYA
ncbi:hypothetical protein MKX01_017559 [Papaver californicum]|nr:hypothetical protein MKX01_017559 [Papaver californicum]